jgi:hypothetical protein
MERGLADAGDTLAAGTREFVLARYGVLCLMCQPMALDRGSCPEVLWLDLPLLVETQNTLQVRSPASPQPPQIRREASRLPNEFSARGVG